MIYLEKVFSLVRLDTRHEKGPFLYICIMKFAKGTYSPFPFMQMKGLSTYEQVVLCWLIYHANRSGTCYPSLVLLCEETGLAKSTLLKNIHSLEKKGIISREKRFRESSKECDSTMYTVHIGSAPDEQHVVRQTNNGSTPDEQPGSAPDEQELMNSLELSISKDIQQVEDSEEKEYGNKEINQVLQYMRTSFRREDFKESQKYQRIYGQNLLNLSKKIGKEEFKKRCLDLIRDEFKLKNCGSLKFIYSELKSQPVKKKETFNLYKPTGNI